MAARLSIGGIILAGGIGEESVAGVIGGALIGISVIPAWYRDKIERLKAGRAAALRDDHFEDRMAELEHRHREQLIQLERTHSGQIAELEERIDFAERLLTERREQIGPG